MLKFIATIVFIFIGIILKPNTDSLFKYLDKYPTQTQLQIIDSLSFNFVVDNNQKIIPTLLQFEELAKLHNELKILAKIYVNMSLAYYYRGKYDENVKYGLKALHLYDSLKCKSELGTMYGELGYQMKHRDLIKATSLMYRGIKILEEVGKIEPLAKIYDNYGVLKELNNQIDSAIYFYQKALMIKMDMNDSLGIPYSLNNLYISNMLINRPANALNYLNESTKIRIKRNDSIGLAENYGYYGHYYSSIGEHRKAIEFNNKSLEIAKKRNYANLVKSAYLDLSNNYEKMGDYQKSLFFHKLFSALQDSLINLETNRTIADLQVQYETVEKERELIYKNEQLEQQKTIKVFIMIIAIVSIISLVVFFRNKQLIARRNEKIKLQMALIEGEQTERNRIALELHDGIANDLNAVIMSLNNCIDTNKIPVNDNIGKLKEKLGESHQNVRKLSHSLMPMSLSQQGLKVALVDLHTNFSNQNLSINIQSIGIDDRLPQFIELNVYRIIQESINNIIKHSKAKSVQIDCNRVNNMLYVSIEDDGVGISNSNLSQKKGLGMQSISNRVKMMNGTFMVYSKDNVGTSIDIQIPIKT